MSFFLMALKHVVMFLVFGGDEFAWERGVTPLSSPVWPAAGILSYLTMVFGLKAVIKEPVVVPQIIPSIHNLILCIGSGIMFVGCVASLFQMILERNSIDFFFCTPVGTAPNGRLFFWSYVYYLSKYYEFLDTTLLVIKLKTTSFLHVFHHAIVVIMAWLWVDQAQTLQWGGLLTNTGVHVVMYYYYYLTSQRLSPWWKKYITTFQIVQFASSFVLLAPFLMYQLVWRVEDGGCEGLGALCFNAAFNLCLLGLFVQFYLGTYKHKQASKKIA